MFQIFQKESCGFVLAIDIVVKGNNQKLLKYIQKYRK
jgi:hypothetical protein